MYKRDKAWLTGIPTSVLLFVIGEVTPAAIFMAGKVKIMGDLSKALKLEQVLKSAREADEKKVAKNLWSSAKCRKTVES